MRTRLDQIERRLQAFVESTARFFPTRSAALAPSLVEAIQDSLFQLSSGSYAATGEYEITLCPGDYQTWQDHPDWLPDLIRILSQAALDEGISFKTNLRFLLREDATLAPGNILVQPFDPERSAGATGVMIVSPQESKEPSDPRPANAFLILDNNRIFPLRLVVVNIGRRLENQLVIDDPRVSRNHAQLRAVKGAYILFDLNSTGGTLVNGTRVSQQTLRPGDVISLAGVPLIYGEENPEGSSPINDTGEFPTFKSAPGEPV